MNQLFNFNGNDLRMVLKNNEPWFVAKDVCDILEIANSRDAVNRLDENEKGVVSTDTLGGMQSLIAVNESGLYELIFGSRKKEARDFKNWIKRDVLPSIRKHGAYMTPETIERTLTDPDFIIGLAGRLKQANEEKIKLQSKIESDRPLVLFAESIQVSRDSILVNDLSTLLKQNGVDIGEKRLFAWLRENGYLIKTGSEYNMPTQRSMDLKIMEVKMGSRNSSDGTVKITRTPKITGKGQVYFINKFADKTA